MTRTNRLWHALLALTWRRWQFRHFGPRSFIIDPQQIVNPRCMSLGDRVRIRHQVRMEALDTLREPHLVIGDNCNIEQNVHIICSHSVQIGRDCSITARCSIIDTWHPFTHIGAHAKIGDGLNAEPASVEIGDNCFLGIGAVIQPNVRLGKRCIVGANSVVLAGEYPDGAVLAGVPARVLRIIPEHEH
ncbi:acyltransferase [Ideonella sp.]|uniref:acyltransferase n=1 Tax=Ideonella sp. TaxID=1929293 RepID=UPI003BB6F91D